jgi:hypothetical protein
MQWAMRETAERAGLPLPDAILPQTLSARIKATATDERLERATARENEALGYLREAYLAVAGKHWQSAAGGHRGPLVEIASALAGLIGERLREFDQVIRALWAYPSEFNIVDKPRSSGDAVARVWSIRHTVRGLQRMRAEIRRLVREAAGHVLNERTVDGVRRALAIAAKYDGVTKEHTEGVCVAGEKDPYQLRLAGAREVLLRAGVPGADELDWTAAMDAAVSICQHANDGRRYSLWLFRARREIVLADRALAEALSIEMGVQPTEIRLLDADGQTWVQTNERGHRATDRLFERGYTQRLAEAVESGRATEVLSVMRELGDKIRNGDVP